jgi:hypothetical protein
MIKQNWNIDSEEVKRILMMHENATKNFYLLKEQDPLKKTITTTSQPKKIPLGPQTFPSGQFDLKYLNTNVINAIKPQIDDYFKQFPENQSINVQVSASESKVPNQKGFNVGDLSQRRGDTITNYLKTILPKNANFLPVNNLGAIGPEWNPSLTKDFSGYTNSQSITIDLSIQGQKSETVDCLVNLKITLDYKREWCYSTPENSLNSTLWEDESKCHQCNEAIFILYANGIALNPSIDLDNGKDGGSRSGTVTITKEQALTILNGKNEIILSIGCFYSECHSDQAHLTITNNEEKELFQGFVSHGNKRLGKEPNFLMTLNKCGEVIDKRNVTAWTQPTKPGRTVVNKRALWRYDTRQSKRIASLAKVYRKLDTKGVIRGPQFGEWDGLKWKKLSKYYDLTNEDIQMIKKYIQDNPVETPWFTQ